MTVIIVAYCGGTPLASATLDADGQTLNWSNAADWWGNCDSLELVAASLRLVIEKGSASPDGLNFPTDFTIATPFAVLRHCALVYNPNKGALAWTLDGTWKTTIANGSFSLTLVSNTLYPLGNGTPQFISAPTNAANRALTATTSLKVSFVREPGNGQYFVPQFECSAGAAPQADFWADFAPAAGVYDLVFSYRDAGHGPKPYLQLAGFSPSSVSSYWNRSIAGQYLISMRAAEPDAPISAILTFAQPSLTRVWYYRACVDVGYVDLGINQDLKSLTVTWRQSCFSTQGPCQLETPNFLTHGGTPFQMSATLTWGDGTWAYPDQIDNVIKGWSGLWSGSPPPIFLFYFSSANATQEQRVRLGALDLHLQAQPQSQGNTSAPKPDPTLQSFMLGYLVPSVPYWPQGPAMYVPQVSVQNLQLATTVQVGSQDSVTTGDPASLDNPIVIPCSPDPATPVPSAQSALLLIQEDNGPITTAAQRAAARSPSLVPIPQSPRTLTLQLLEQQGNSDDPADTDIDLLVLDQTPFIVAKVRLPSLLGNADDSDGILAEWSNNSPDGPGWQTKSGAQNVTLLLPSQGVGEQTERRTGDVLHGSPLDYRFSPAAQLQLTPPQLDSQNGYFEAPWNLRRLLTSPGQDVPGVPLPSFRAELLYGLTVAAQSSGLRLAEIGAVTGRLAAPNSDVGWLGILNAFETRLAALTPWDGLQPNTLTLSNGVQYTLRKNAQLAYPCLDQVSPPGPQPYPTAAGGLEGGVGWIFEFLGEYAPVWQKPQSTAALLADPIFSALGGWAKQRAEFLSGIVTINSHVEMGRVSTISLEILGRIGVFWNRAKLVTVYERTVQPSEQFQETQDPLMGRPIVRKVEQYVEILEPIRQYPEAGTAAVNTACIQGIEFKSKIVYVDTGWGGPVLQDPNNQGNTENNGLRVPLWKPGANPFVYPKPHILVQVAVDPNTGTATQNQEIDEPEKLCFYSTETAGPDPNAWKSVPEVDFADVDTSVSTNKDYQGYRLSISPGLGAFTWRLLPGPFSTNVVAQRSSSAISASLTNVSMMRSTPTQPQPQPHGSPALKPPLTALKQVPDHVSSLFQEVASALGSSGTVTLKEILDSTDLGDYFGLLKTSAGQACEEIAVTVTNVESALAHTLSDYLDQLTANASSYLTQAITLVSEAVDSGPTPDEVAATVQEVTDLINSPIAALGIDPSVIIANVSPQVDSLNNDFQQLKAALPYIGSPGIPDVNNPHLLDGLINIQQMLSQNVRSLTSQLAPFQALSGTAFPPGWTPLAGLGSRLAASIGSLVQQVTTTSSDVQTALGLVASDIDGLSTALTKLGQFSVGPLTLDPFNPPLNKATTVGELKSWLDNVANSDNAFDDTVQQQIAGWTQQAADTINATVGQWISSTAAAWIPADGSVQNALGAASDGLQGLLLMHDYAKDLSAQLSDLHAQFEATMSSFLDVGKLLSNIGAPTSLPSIFAEGSSALSLIRAFGAPPIADGLAFALATADDKFNLQNLAYFFDSTLPQVPITTNVQSILTESEQALADLSPVGLTVPIASLLDRLVPDPEALEAMALSGVEGVFQNLGGLNFEGLFSGIFPPLNAPDGIQISHSVNQQTLKVEVDADIDIPFADDIDVFNEGPIYLRLLGARFQATVTLQAGVGQQSIETVSGAITGNWDLQIAGTSLITFVNTSLTFDQSGHVQFNVSPEKIQLSSVMQFIDDLINSFLPSGSGLTVHFDTAPVEVICDLDLPLPDIAGGVFALSNVRLGALFGVGVGDDGHFLFQVGMNLSSMEAPFAIVVFILGGGGWVDAQLTYEPGEGRRPEVTVEIGISAVASLEIALGPISGGVMIAFSLFAQYDSQAASTLDLGIVILVAGHVSLLDIVEVDITLMLEADYDAGQLTGRGSVDVDIKICWCFTLSVHQEVEYTFGNHGGGSAQMQVSSRAASGDTYWTAANDYIDTLAA
jgi:hypothetical protein